MVLTGLGLWVWDIEQCPKWLSIAKRIGANFVLGKKADGEDPWKQWWTIKEQCQESGIQPIPWAYNYGEPTEPYILTATDEKIVVLNPEIEFERLHKTAQLDFITVVREIRATGTTVGLATWARPDIHPQYPFEELAKVVDFWIPMVAWPMWDPPLPQHWFDHWDQFGYGPTVPWLPTYGAKGQARSPHTLAMSLKLALERYPAVSIWGAHTLTESQQEVLALQHATRPTYDKDAARDALNGLWQRLNEAETAIRSCREETRELKTALGLPNV